MARKPQATGPAAYHARLELEKIATLEARVADLESRLTGWCSPFQLSAKVREAVHTTYATAHKDGYRAGWIDKTHGVVPHQYPESAGLVGMLTAADR